jgi:hypothetical protein
MRLEYKYLVPNRSLPQVRQALAPFTVADRYMLGKPGGYTVRSIYFDTSERQSYDNKQAGVEVRKKVRIRGYNRRQQRATVFLEIKRKQGPFVSKNRAPVTWEHLSPLLASGDATQYVRPSAEFPNAPQDSRRFLFHVYRLNLRPSALIVYEREAYEAQLGFPLRITFDKYIRSAPFPALDELFDEGRLSHELAGYFILEIKLPDDAAFPAWLKRAIKRFDLQPMALSKYTICLDSQEIAHRPSGYGTMRFSRHVRNCARTSARTSARELAIERMSKWAKLTYTDLPQLLDPFERYES